MELEEKKLSSRPVFDGKIMKVKVDTVSLPNGNTAERELIEHNGAVAIVPITNRGNIVLVRQYRYAVGQTLIEIPAGKLELNEINSPEMAARRELEEETGYQCAWMDPLGVLYGIPAYSSEKVHLFVAKCLWKTEQHLDEDEFLDVFEVPIAEAVEMATDGRITDAKTVAGILRVRNFTVEVWDEIWEEYEKSKKEKSV